MIPLKDNIPNVRFPLITVALVAINVIVYLLAIRHGGSLFGGPSTAVEAHYSAIPYELTHPGRHCELVHVASFEGVAETIACEGEGGVRGHAGAQPPTWETVFTSMFMHASFLHIAGNMLFLAIFGPKVEDAMGKFRFVGFYLVGGLIALAAQVIVSPDSSVPTLGASGAIAAVLGGYILLYPSARILSLVFIVFFFTIVELPALLLLGFWFLEQLYFGAANLSDPVGGGGGVAYLAHVGGFVFGLLAIRALASKPASIPPRLPVY